MTPTPGISQGLLHNPRGRTPVPQRGQADPPPASPPSPGHRILHVAVQGRVRDKPAGSRPGQEPGTMGGCLAFGDPAPPKEGEEQPSQPRPQLGGVTRPLRAQQQKKDGAGGHGGRAAPPDEGGTACRCEKAPLTPPPTPTAHSPTGGFPRALGVPPCLLSQLPARASPGAGPPSSGVPRRAPCPGRRPSVRLGREDEESVFLLANPLHELVDSADGARLGAQGTVAYVELEGAGDLGEEMGMGTHLHIPAGGWYCTSPRGLAQGLPSRTRGGSRAP